MYSCLLFNSLKKILEKKPIVRKTDIKVSIPPKIKGKILIAKFIGKVLL